jgi:hypothetical protein
LDQTLAILEFKPLNDLAMAAAAIYALARESLWKVAFLTYGK